MKQLKMSMAFFIIIFSSLMVRADLLGRIELEDAFKDRIEKALKIQDPTAQVTVRINYNRYLTEEDLPGTNQTAGKIYFAEKTEISDINKISIQYFSEKSELQKMQSDLIYSLIPLEKSRISISFKLMLPVNPKPTPIEVADIREIADKSIQLLSLMLGSVLGLACLFFGVALFFNNSKNRAMFKQQVGQVVSALTNGSFSGGSSSSIHKGFEKLSNSVIQTSDDKYFADYSEHSMQAIFSDFYWCEKDQEAQYLWNNITTQHKTVLLQNLDFMYDYAMFFSRLEGSPNEDIVSFAKHPYYNQPLKLYKTSQESLLQAVKKNFGLWNKISPLRQQSLPLSLKEKIKANSSSNLNVVEENFPESRARVLPQHVSFGEISLEDESEIFKDEKIIPINLREHIPSLVWLALKDVDFIKEKLEKLDAKFLASAWISAPEILEKLEQSLPEKKLQLLKSYLIAVKPLKSSSAFQALFALGLETNHQEYASVQKAS